MGETRSYALNHQLRQLLDESGLTGEALASEVNAAGAGRGLELRYSRSSVAHWLSGVHPRQPVPALVAEVFSAVLGRSVTVAQTGLADDAALPSGAATTGSGLSTDNLSTEMAELAGPTRDRGRRREVRVSRFAPPEWPVAGTTVHRRRRSDPDAPRIGQSEVASAHLMRDLFSTADAERGGRATRPALGLYAGTTLATWLRADASPAVRRKLLAVAAELCYLYAFMCFDDEDQGPAQRYFLISAQLAAEAGDRAVYAIALRGMSVQCHHLGHRKQSLALAESAVGSIAGTAVRPRTRAFLHGQVAVALAGVGDGDRAPAELRTAERHLSRAEEHVPAIGAYNTASLAHQHAEVAELSGDSTEAIRLFKASSAQRPAIERRSLAVVLGRLAQLQFAAGHLDAVCDTWLQLLDVRRMVGSARVDAAVTEMRRLVEPHRDTTSVRALLDRADALQPG